MKKIIALILSAVMLTMTLAACGEEKSKRKDRDDDTAKTSLAAIDSGSDGESTLSTPEVSESISAQISEDTICLSLSTWQMGLFVLSVQEIPFYLFLLSQAHRLSAKMLVVYSCSNYIDYFAVEAPERNPVPLH